MTYANITKKKLKTPTYANITKKYIPKQNEFQKTIQKLEESNKPIIKKTKRKNKKKKKKIRRGKSSKKKEKINYIIDKELKKKKESLRVIFISGHGSINLIPQSKIKSELFDRINMSKYQPNKKNSKLNDFYLLKLGGIMDTVYNIDLYYLLFLLMRQPKEPKIKDTNNKELYLIDKYMYEFQKNFFNFTNQYNEIDIFNLFNKLRKLIYRSNKTDVNYNFRFYPKHIEEYKKLREKYPSDDNIYFYPNNNNISTGYTERMGIYDLTLDYNGDKSIKNNFDSIYKKLKNLNLKDKPYKRVEGDDLPFKKYIHQINTYESLLLFDYDKRYKKILEKNEIVDYKYYKEYTKFNRRLMDKIENQIDINKDYYNRKQIDVNEYQNIEFKTSDIIELIYNTIIETEYNNNGDNFHKDMAINNKKILIIDGTCKGMNNEMLNDNELKRIKYFRRQSIDPTLKDKFDFTKTYFKETDYYENKENIIWNLLIADIEKYAKNKLDDKLLYKSSYKDSLELFECVDKIMDKISKTGKPSGEFKKNNYESNSDSSNIKRKNIMMMKKLLGNSN